jgi:peptide/nickel transport system substrate-binding protein
MSQELEYLSQQVALGRHSRRDFLGRAAALGVSATVANALLAGAAQAAGPRRGGTLKIGMQGGAATDSMDPALAANQVTFSVGRAWGEELLRLSPTGQLEPRLATEWRSSPDAKAWVFKIRKGVQFHNGKEMTAADVVATMERHSGPDTKSGALGIMRGVDSVTRDGDTVIFTMKDANADFPYLLTDYHLLIQPNGGKDAPRAAIGTGPYKMGTNEPGVRHVGTRFENYWASKTRGHAEQVEFVVLNDSTARTAALQSGRVHIINRVDPKVVDLIKRAPGVTIQTASGRGHYVFIAHCNTAPFNNLDLRLALKYAMDRKEMVEKILRGFGSVGNDFPINASYPLFTELPQRPFDTDKAAFHYKKSGHNDAILLRTSEVAFPGAVDAAQLYQASCAKAGIKIEVKREPGDGYWSAVWNKQPFSTSYWGGRAVQDQMYSTAYITGADWNDTRFFNPTFDKMVAAARGEINQAKRKQMYRDMAMIVHNEGGVIVPMFNDTIDATGPKVRGWVKNPNAELMGGMAASECWLEGPDA